MIEPWYKLPDAQNSFKNVTIIGGGLAGSAAAYFLAAEGLEVTLIERQCKVGIGASGNPAGIIMPLITDKSDLIGEFYDIAFKTILAHLDTLSNQVEGFKWHQTGVLDLSEQKSAKDISKIFPNNISRSGEGLLIDNAGWIEPEKLCEANLVPYSHNIRTILNTEALSLHKDSNGWGVFDKNGIISHSAAVIIANSFDIKIFEQTKWLPVKKVRGQISYCKNDVENRFGQKFVTCYPGGYIISAGDINYIGASYDVNCDDEDISEGSHMENIENLRRFIDIKYEDIIGGRVAFRAVTPDRRPVIGAVPDREFFIKNYADLHHGRPIKNYPQGKYLEGLYLTSGHGSRGITSSVVSAQYLTKIITGKTAPFSDKIARLLSPARFIIRDLKKAY